MPPQYDLHPRRQGTAPALVTLAELVSARRELPLAHVKAHAGHTLNEGADLLAKKARRWVAAGTETMPQKAMRADAADIAATFLAQWHRENPNSH